MRGEIVLITGGSSGIGLAAAERFARRGAHVILLARDADRLREAAASISGEVRTITGDVRSGDSLRSVMEEIGAREGKLDVLLNCAGRFEIGPAEELGPEIAAELIEVNYLGTVRAIHAALPLLRSGARRSIVSVSSIAGKVAPPFMAAYAASKFALNGYTHSLRQELAGEGFHLGLVAPGPVDTPMIEGRVRTRYYPLPFGVPIITPQKVAGALLRCVEKRASEIVLPRRLAASGKIAAAFPGIVDLVYRGYGKSG